VNVVAAAVPVVGESTVWVTGAVVLALVLFTGSWAGALVTVAHEGGHMALAVLTGRNHSGFTLRRDGGGATRVNDGRWGIGDILTTFAGYPAPPLLGFGGAVLVVNGQLGVVLWAALVLMVVVAFQARNGLAIAVAVLAVGGLGWTAWFGGPELQVTVALGLVWLLLIGGARATLTLSRGDGSDPYWLARHTLIPRIVWHAVFVVIAGACLWMGGSSLLGV